ncbi:MAG: hypothetical protein ACRC77_03560 [Bacteroidales bacterium]
MKNITFLLSTLLFIGCSKQLDYQQILSQAYNDPISDNRMKDDNIINLNRFFPDIENIDSVTSKMAIISRDTSDWSRIRIERYDANKPVILNVWKKGAYADAFVLPAFIKRDQNCLIVSKIDDFGRLIIQSNQKDISWYAFWQNAQIPVNKMQIRDGEVILPVPENAKSMDESVIRVMAVGENGLSNELFIPLKKGKVLTLSSEASYYSKNQLSSYLQQSDFYEKENQLLRTIGHEITDSLNQNRCEWGLSQTIAEVSDNQLSGILKNYMNYTSILVNNPYPTDKVFQMQLPDNIKIGNLKSHLGNSIKQSGNTIVINMKPNSSEIVTSEMY